MLLHGKCIRVKVTYFSHNLLNICPLHQDVSTDKEIDSIKHSQILLNLQRSYILIHFYLVLLSIFRKAQWI